MSAFFGVTDRVQARSAHAPTIEFRPRPTGPGR